MKKKRISLSARSYAIIIVIMILVYAQVLLISNGAYRQAVFSPYEQRLAEAKIPAESMVPFLDGLTRYLGTEELRRAREGLDKDETGILYFLGDHATVLEDGMESTAATDLILLRDALNECRESLFADGVYAEVGMDGKVYQICRAERNGDYFLSINVFGEETAVSTRPASDYASPVFQKGERGYELMRCIPLELDGAEGRIWVRYDMSGTVKNSVDYLAKIILSFLLLTVVVSLISVYLLRRSVIRPVLRLSEAAKNFTPEEDGTYSADKVSRVRLRSGDEIGDLSREIRTMQEKIVENTGSLAALTAEREHTRTELELARQIQASALPNAIPNRAEFDLYASMTPARLVGGDFYDYFLVDDDHLALVIADVSGKGVPAALFMMISMSLIRNQLKSGSGPAEALERVNRQLYERNDSAMFVTVWLAVLEISTGRGTACNAGHENPAYRKADGKFELIKYKHDILVGISPNARYHDRPFEMRPGDCLFVYTDGVPEASDADEAMFGEERLAATLNKAPDAAPEEVIRRVHEQVDLFAGGAPQFDDITMLCMKYHGG